MTPGGQTDELPPPFEHFDEAEVFTLGLIPLPLLFIFEYVNNFIIFLDKKIEI
jgi:hypothetical protein